MHVRSVRGTKEAHHIIQERLPLNLLSALTRSNSRDRQVSLLVPVLQPILFPLSSYLAARTT